MARGGRDGTDAGVRSAVDGNETRAWGGRRTRPQPVLLAECNGTLRGAVEDTLEGYLPQSTRRQHAEDQVSISDLNERLKSHGSQIFLTTRRLDLRKRIDRP